MAACAKLDPPINSQNRISCARLDHVFYLNKYGRLKVAKNPLPFAPPLDQLWLKVEKVIDVFHLKNHVSVKCRENFSPAELKKATPILIPKLGSRLSLGWGDSDIFYAA